MTPLEDLLSAYAAGSDPRRVCSATLETFADSDEEAPSLHAVISIDAEAVTAAASESRERWQKSKQRSLEGVPVLIKDVINVSGHPTTGGLPFPLESAPTDSTVAQRLRQTGAVLLPVTATRPRGGQHATTSAWFLIGGVLSSCEHLLSISHLSVEAQRTRQCPALMTHRGPVRFWRSAAEPKPCMRAALEPTPSVVSTRVRPLRLWLPAVRNAEDKDVHPPAVRCGAVEHAHRPRRFGRTRQTCSPPAALRPSTDTHAQLSQAHEQL